jgi:hypothetical protein
MEIIRAESENYIYISISKEDEVSMSWEFLQTLKDLFYPDIDFIEVYPAKKNIINKGNVRHLFHVKNCIVPNLSDLESEDFRIII